MFNVVFCDCRGDDCRIDEKSRIELLARSSYTQFEAITVNISSLSEAVFNDK